MERILIYKPWTEVILKRSWIEWVIIGAVIWNGNIYYDVSYFDNGKYIWLKLYDFEFSISANAEKQSIWFIIN